jgi:hypothetical protein
MTTVVARIWLPDRPGALGQVASRIGAVRGDVLAIEILERGGGQVVDELTIRLGGDSLIPLLSSEVDAVDGVSVESIRPVDPDRADASLLALSIGAELARSPEGEVLGVLCHGVHRVVEADWTVVIRADEIVESIGEHPDRAWLLAYGAGSEHLDALDAGPTDLVWSHLADAAVSVAAGRADRPIHERERVRMSLLAHLADAIMAFPGHAGRA